MITLPLGWPPRATTSMKLAPAGGMMLGLKMVSNWPEGEKAATKVHAEPPTSEVTWVKPPFPAIQPFGWTMRFTTSWSMVWMFPAVLEAKEVSRLPSLSKRARKPPAFQSVFICQQPVKRYLLPTTATWVPYHQESKAPGTTNFEALLLNWVSMDPSLFNGPLASSYPQPSISPATTIWPEDNGATWKRL